MHLPSLVNFIPFPPRFFIKTLTSSCRPSRTSLTHLLPLALYQYRCDLKTAVIKPLLKKQSLDKNLLKIYRPISNLPVLSKSREKVVLHKLHSHPQENNLSNPFQSAYRAGHSTETVLLRTVNDILSALDNDNISVLLLDLSAAFDITDHQILSRLNFGIQSTALQWFQSYLSDRYQSTSVNNLSSSPSQLLYSVPRGSALGPILFNLYTTPLSDIANHSVNHQLFADDTQLFSFPFRLPRNLQLFPSLTRLLLALTASPSRILPGILDSFSTQICPRRSTS